MKPSDRAIGSFDSSLMCVQLPAQTDASYIAQISQRVARMFQRYAASIDPDSEEFLTFISKYLAERNVTDPRAIPYSQLYTHIKQGIRDYVRQHEAVGEAEQEGRES
jgi:hypothetical protein